MPSAEVVKAVYILTKGATLLKAGRMGRPHFRQFKLSEDLKKLQWESPKKDKGESAVEISCIEELVKGQTTKIFEGNPIPEYESLSFSLIYKQGSLTRSLDIVCKDRAEFDEWTLGLEALLGGFKDVQAVKDVAESVPQSETDGKSEKLSLEFGFVGEKVSVKEDACDVYTWGSSPCGTLGHGEETEEDSPRVVEALLGRDIRVIACGVEHTLAIGGSGEVYSWGSGRGGKLGLGHIQDRYTPLRLQALSEKNIIAVACHSLHSAAVAASGELFTWGRAGGHLGYDVDGRKQTIPRTVDAFSNKQITAVACGLDFTLAVDSTGEAYSFGENGCGQLGLGNEDEQSSPQLIETLKGNKIAMVACGTTHAAAVSDGGDLWLWGQNSYGQLATGDTKDHNLPLAVPSTYWNEAVKSVSCGDRHTAVLTVSGTLYTFGDGRSGQLGVKLRSDSSYLATPYAVPIPAQHQIAMIACGACHTAALSDSGDLFTWGKGSFGRLGHGDHRDRFSATEVESMEYKQVTSLSCGSAHTAACVIRSWVHDQETKSCMACKQKFTTVRRRHHCRKCGGIFCASCSSKRHPILEIGYSDPVRVCDRCYHTLSESNA